MVDFSKLIKQHPLRADYVNLNEDGSLTTVFHADAIAKATVPELNADVIIDGKRCQFEGEKLVPTDEPDAH